MGPFNFLESWFVTGDGVFAVDEQQRIVYWNQGAESILGYTFGDVAGKYCYEVLRGMDEKRTFGCSRNCLSISGARCGKLYAGQNLQCAAKDGTFRWISLSHILVRPSDDLPSAVVHVFRDETLEVEAKNLLRSFAGQISDYMPLNTGDNADHSPKVSLTSRELQVLGLLAEGEGTSTIAQLLTISKTTARNHIQNVLGKLGVHTRIEAVAYALRSGLVHPQNNGHNPSWLEAGADVSGV